jgi:hypothetical protein
MPRRLEKWRSLTGRNLLARKTPATPSRPRARSFDIAGDRAALVAKCRGDRHSRWSAVEPFDQPSSGTAIGGARPPHHRAACGASPTGCGAKHNATTWIGTGRAHLPAAPSEVGQADSSRPRSVQRLNRHYGVKGGNVRWSRRNATITSNDPQGPAVGGACPQLRPAAPAGRAALHNRQPVALAGGQSSESMEP